MGNKASKKPQKNVENNLITREMFVERRIIRDDFETIEDDLIKSLGDSQNVGVVASRRNIQFIT